MSSWQLKLVTVSGLRLKEILEMKIEELWLQPLLEAMVLILLMDQNTGASTLVKWLQRICICVYFVCYWYLFVLTSCSCRGLYGPDVSLVKLKDFHRRRLQVLVEAGPDLLAFETIPNKLEAQVFSFKQSKLVL